MPVATRHYHALSELLNDVSTLPIQPCWKEYAKREDAQDDDWYGGTLKQALKLGTRGWPEGWAQVRAITDKLDVSLTGATGYRHEVAFDVAGDYVDVGRYMTGEPECMANYVEIEAPVPSTRFVSIEVGHMVSAGISTEQITRRGAAVCALVDLLENAGYRVELVSADYSSRIHRGNADTGMKVTTVLKRFDDALDRDRVGFWLIHPAAVRRIIFRLMDQIAEFDDGRFRPVAKPATNAELYIPPAITSTTGNEFDNDDNARAWVVAKMHEAVAKLASASA